MRVAIRIAMALLCLTPVCALAQGSPPVTPPAAQDATVQEPVVQKLFRADSKVAFVDLQRIFSESQYGIRGMAQITALQKNLSDGLAGRSRDLQAMSEKMKTQQSLVSEQVWLEWNADFLKMQREAQFAEQEAQIQVEQLQQRLLANFEDMVRPAIESVRAQHDLWAVFALQPQQESAGTLSLIAADPAIDLSAEVIALLNEPQR